MRPLPLACTLLACGLAMPGQAAEVTLAFRLANFSHPLAITNRYSPMVAGRRAVFYEVEDDECSVDDIVVTQQAKTNFRGPYAGLAARVVRDRAWEDDDCDGGRDRLAEDTFDWFAQDNAGNVWYLGENTTAFTYDAAGHVIARSTAGSWEAGRNGAIAGLIMLAHPATGLSYQQEFAEGIAEDRARVEKIGQTVTTGLGTFSGCIVTKESTPLAPNDIERKTYCPNVGLVLVELQGGKGGAEAVDLGL